MKSDNHKGKAILVGAGAETPKPFGLPSGKRFVFDTCYRSDEKLHAALKEFYANRLSNRKNKTYAPSSYQPLFLYSPKNPEFRKFADYVFANSRGSSLHSQLASFATRELGEVDTHLNDEGAELLFNMLIKRDTDEKELTALRETALDGIPDDAYFGTIESYFASLVNPRARSKSFWRLINYYWSAFFAVAEPLIRKAYGNDSLYNQQGIYRFTLSNLDDVIKTITEQRLYSEPEIHDTYYGKLHGKFDDVLTTNYTGLSEALVPSKGKPCTYLSGALWMFESLETLTVRDIRSEPIEHDEFVFPFLMTQVPIKPIVDACQLKAYARALGVLDQTNLLVVLGYSFCNSDRHVGALIHDYMQSSDNRLIYLDYSGEQSADGIKKLLRLDTDREYDIQIMGTDSSSLRQLIGILDCS